MHGGLGQTPAGRWAQGVAESGAPPPLVTSAAAFLVDFLPVIRRKVTRTGFAIDHVGYFSNALKPWIARRDRLGKFVIRRDPRDISRVWVLEPDGDQYLEVPYRTLSRPAVTLWEHRQAVARLRQQGREQVDEQALFSMIEQMRSISDGAQRATRKRQRERERRNHLGALKRPALPAPPPDAPPDRERAEDDAAPAPFDEIEEW